MKLIRKHLKMQIYPNKENVRLLIFDIIIFLIQLIQKKAFYPKGNLKNKSFDSTKKNREFGIEISNMDKNKKEIRYPKNSNPKENKNNIQLFHANDENIINNKNRKKTKIRKRKLKESKQDKSKINILIKKINKISIDKIEEQTDNNKNNDNKYIKEIKYNENPIEEYEEEIMKNLFHEENKNRPIYSLFPVLMQNNINNQNLSYMKRFSFINLFISFQHELILKQETLYLTINIFDRYIQKLNSQNIIASKIDINKIAVTCLFIASKYEEIYSPSIKEFLQIFKIKYTKKEILITEDEILSALNFEVLTVYPISFLKKFCLYNINDLDKKEKEDMELCFNGAQFFLEICLIEPKFCELKPSLQAAICLYLARKFLLFKNANGRIWNFELIFRTNYTETTIKKYIKIAVKTIKNFFGNIYTKNFMALPLYLKYCNHEYQRIANKLKCIINGEER